jgi:hypothetical protein
MSVTFGDVLAGVQRRLGKDPLVTMSAPYPGLYADAISEAVRVAYEHDFWPRLMRIEERTLQEHADGFRYVAWAQAGRTAIGAVDAERCLWARDPRVHTGERAFSGVAVTAEGVVAPAGVAGAVFLRFRPEPPTFASTDGATAFPGWLRRFCVLHAAGNLLADDQARFRTLAAAEDELERLHGVEFDLGGVDTRARR